MLLQDRVVAFVQSRPFRTGIALVTAAVWFGFVVAGEAGRNWALAVVYGIPAALVVVWWRTRPWVGIGLAALALFLILFGAASGTPVDAGGVVACMTAWFAILGASLSGGRLLRWTAAALVALDAMLSLVFNGVPSFVIVVLAGAVALGAGWGWQQLRHSTALEGRLTETAERSRAAERDVLLELERNRIAREVHDVVAHSLAVVIAQADGARFAAETKPASVAPALEAISDTARRALGEVRTMLHDLRTSGDAGVVPGSDDLAGLVAGIRALDVAVDEATFGEPQPLDERSGLALYRIAQEALTNAMRHGERAEPVGFELDWGEREVVLVVTNSVPSDGVAATERAGHGIPGMRERATDAGGDCSAGVGTNGRFRVRVALPIPQEPLAEPEPAANPLAALLAAVAEPRA